LVELIQDCEDLEIVSYIDAAELAKIQIIIYKEAGQYFYVQTPYDDALVGLFNKIGGGFLITKVNSGVLNIAVENVVRR
jgi:hypothetical protein